ncbi:MAG: response regulator [Motiliproteus sp.]
MSIPILICDDSAVAQKQLARSLPTNWDVDISYAGNGAEAIPLIKQDKADILFLDLNMPVMDGYQLLAEIRAQDLPTLVIVVSGDVQAEARTRVMDLGALDFICKPIDRDTLFEVLQRYGILQELEGNAAGDNRTRLIEDNTALEVLDGYQEVTNVAMGQAADLLARLLNVFIELPIPQVHQIYADQLPQRISEAIPPSKISVVSQGFVAARVSGEALLFVEESDLQGFSRLIGRDLENDPVKQLDLLMEIANILIGACMAGFAEQLDLKFSMGHPAILGSSIDATQIPLRTPESDEQLLTIEILYGINDHQINCSLLLIFTGDSIAELDSRINLIMG